MKKIGCIIAFLAVLTMLGCKKEPLNATDNMVQEGRLWVTHVWWAVSPPQDYTEVYRIEGDTTLGGKTYKKIYCYHTPDLSDRKLYVYACRQKGKKVYIRFYREKKERLFFDFSPMVGSRFKVEEHGLDMKVTEVGKTTINGQSVRYVRLINKNPETNWMGEDTWVEGIGSLNYGIVWDGMRCMAGAKSYTLLCCHQGNDVLWKRSDEETCFVGSHLQTE